MRRPGAGALGGGEGMLALVSRAGVPCAPRACPRCARSTPSLSSVRLDRADFAHRRPRHHIHGILALCALALPVLALRAAAVRALAVRVRAVRSCWSCGVLVQRLPTSCDARRHHTPRRPRRLDMPFTLSPSSVTSDCTCHALFPPSLPQLLLVLSLLFCPPPCLCCFLPIAMRF